MDDLLHLQSEPQNSWQGVEFGSDRRIMAERAGVGQEIVEKFE
jgi:hypothetical protein